MTGKKLVSVTVRILFLTLACLLAFCGCATDMAAPAAVEVRLDTSEYKFTDKQQTLSLSAAVYPLETEDKTVMWMSSDPSVATVDAAGNVTPVSNGYAMITARAGNGGAVGCCVIEVALPPEYVSVEGILLTDNTLSFTERGQTALLSAYVWPENATDKSIIWSSSDPEVAQVDTEGNVTALAPGRADIVATTADGSFSAICSVTCDIFVAMKDVNFSRTSFTFRNSDDELILTPVWEPLNTTERGLIWSSTNEKVATVDPETGVVTPHKNGTATIYAVSENRKKQAYCKVTVNFTISAEGITLPDHEISLGEENATYVIKPSVRPSDASNKNVFYTSSDDSVATVSANGTVTAVGNGVAVITVTTEDGGFSETLLVNVQMRIHPESVRFSLYSHSFSRKGEKIKVQVTVYPENAYDKSYTLTSADESVATVSQDGTITAVGYGYTSIYVKTNDGGIADTFFVIFNAPKGDTEPDPGESPVVRKEKLKGVWVGTVSNLDFPSRQGLSADKLKEELDAIVTTCKDAGLNAIFFQVRPTSDAFYKFSIFPSSTYLTGKQGSEIQLDCLEYLIQKAHAANIEVHAWINPYRIAFGHDLTALSEDNPARKNPEWVVFFKDKSGNKSMWYDPGIPAVRQLITDGVMEIVNNYSVDGIHFDDYFYPYDTNAAGFSDDISFALYNPANMSRADWRRNNNDSLILSIHNAIEKSGRKVAFGVAPFGVWAKKSSNSLGTDIPNSNESYYAIYADTRKWVLSGWLDYICPQVYWETTHTTAPFCPVVDWWNELVSTTKVELYIGMQMDSTQNKSKQPYKTYEELKLQADYISSKSNVSGGVYFSYRDIVANRSNCVKVTKGLFSGSSSTVKKASDTLFLAADSLSVSNDTRTAFVLGVSDPEYPLYVNGEPVTTRSTTGYFSYYATGLSVGDNVFTFTHKGVTKIWTVTRAKASVSSDTMKSFGFVSGSFSPQYDYANVSGTKLTFYCTAPAGSTVYAKVGDYTVKMTTSAKAPSDGSFVKAYYEGTFVLPEISGNAVIGTPVFYAEMKGQTTAVKVMTNTVEVINDPRSYIVRMNSDGCDLAPTNVANTEDEYRKTSAGTWDTVVSKARGFALLGSGLYVKNGTYTRDETKSYALSAISNITFTQSGDGKKTVMTLTGTDKNLYSVWAERDTTTIMLYNVGYCPELKQIASNPLFSGISVKEVSNTSVQITLTHKKSDFTFGYSAELTDTSLILSFRNPISISSGSKPLKGINIIVDPGHSDSTGSVSFWAATNYTEAYINLTISRLVKAKLEALGATVSLSHNGEQKYSLDELISQMRMSDPDMTISLHMDHPGQGNGVNPVNNKGATSYYCYGAGKLLSDTMIKTYASKTGLNMRGSKVGRYKVARHMQYPAVLFEMGFISNIYDFEWFVADGGFDAAAQAVTDGILAYYKAQS